jgi:peptidylprolyl isomerase
MRTVQQGDRVRVHFIQRTHRGDTSSSRGRAPLELTVGTEHRRLPGLGLALVGLNEGERVRLLVPPEQAYGRSRPERVRRLARARFPDDEVLAVGSRVRVTDRKGRRRLVRVVEVQRDAVVVDANHPWAGQTVALEVEVVSIGAPPSRGDGGSPEAANAP